MVEDDIFRIASLEILLGILIDTDAILLNKTLLRYVMKCVIEANIHNREELPHIVCKFEDVVWSYIRYTAVESRGIAFSKSKVICIAGFRTSTLFQEESMNVDLLKYGFKFEPTFALLGPRICKNIFF